jgi:hypothetical protein
VPYRRDDASAAAAAAETKPAGTLVAADNDQSH